MGLALRQPHHTTPEDNDMNTRTIDITPTWGAVLPLFIAAVQSDSFVARTAATQELTRMARLADIGGAMVKAQREATADGRVQSDAFGEWVR